MTDDSMMTIAQCIRCASHKPQPDEYMGADGLWTCNKCHTPRECKLISPGDPSLTFKPTVMCQCEKAAEDAYLEAKRKRDEQNKLEGLRRASLMGDRFKASTFDRWEIGDAGDRKAYKYCKGYADRFEQMYAKNQGLLMYGGPGAGKTFAAACIANQLLDAGVSVIMTSFVKLMAMCEGKDDEIETVKTLSSVQLLIIDDLGAERTTSYATEKVYHVIDSRYGAMRPMILTTNHTLAQIQGGADMGYKRIYDRVIENCFPIAFTTTSRRQDEAARRYQEMEQMFE